MVVKSFFIMKESLAGQFNANFIIKALIKSAQIPSSTPGDQCGTTRIYIKE
jgi:hypothetical protein